MTYKGEWLAVARQEIKRLRKLLKLAPVLVLAVLPLWAQSGTVYDSVLANFVNVNSGNPGWATFYFGHPVNGEPGTTALIIQCGFHRAELLTDFDAVGQRQSQFFAVTCSGTTAGEYYRTLTFTLNSAPLQESLVMYASDGTTTNLNLTVNSATWTVTNPGRAQKTSGSAEIVVQ